MADIPGSLSKLNDVEVDADANLSEGLHTKIGANINQLIDDLATAESDISTLQTDVTTLEAGNFLSVTASASGTLTGPGPNDVSLSSTFTSQGRTLLFWIQSGTFTLGFGAATPGNQSLWTLRRTSGTAADIKTFMTATSTDLGTGPTEVGNIGHNFGAGSPQTLNYTAITQSYGAQNVAQGNFGANLIAVETPAAGTHTYVFRHTGTNAACAGEIAVGGATLYIMEL